MVYSYKLHNWFINYNKNKIKKMSNRKPHLNLFNSLKIRKILQPPQSKYVLGLSPRRGLIYSSYTVIVSVDINTVSDTHRREVLHPLALKYLIKIPK